MNCLLILLLLCCCGGNKGVGCCEEHNHSCGCKEDAGCATGRQSRRCEDDVFEDNCDRVRSDRVRNECDCREQETVRGNQWDYPRFSQGNLKGCNDN